MSKVVNANDAASFQREVLDAKVAVIVDFWAPWCGPCRTVAPELDALAASYGDALKIVKVDIDTAPDIAARYDVQSIPNLSLFSSGQLIRQIIGARPRQGIEDGLALKIMTAGARKN